MFPKAEKSIKAFFLFFCMWTNKVFWHQLGVNMKSCSNNSVDFHYAFFCIYFLVLHSATVWKHKELPAWRSDAWPSHAFPGCAYFGSIRLAMISNIWLKSQILIKCALISLLLYPFNQGILPPIGLFCSAPATCLYSREFSLGLQQSAFFISDMPSTAGAFSLTEPWRC